MPGFTPGHRSHPPFYPFKRDTFGNRLLYSVDDSVTAPASLFHLSCASLVE